MSLKGVLEPVARLLRKRTRRSFLSEGRAHVEFSGIGADELPAFERALRATVPRDGRVRTVQVNAHTHRVVVTFEPGACVLAEIVHWVEDSERAAGIAEPDFEGMPEHPSDAEPILRKLVAMGADLGAFFMGLGLSVTPIPAVPFAGNAAALTALLQSVDRLREEIERRIGPERTEIVLDLGLAVFSAAAQRPLTSLVDGVHKLALFREARARQAAWWNLEPGLTREMQDGTIGGAPREPRPVDLPRGPIEEYADRAWIVSLAGFAVSFATTRSFQRAISAIYGSLPRPARLGRDVFIAEITRILSSRGALVLDAKAMRRLDRIDCLVLEGDLVSAKSFSLGNIHVSKAAQDDQAKDALAKLFDPERPLERQTLNGYGLCPWKLSHATAPVELEQVARSLAEDGALVLALEHDAEVVAAVEVTITARTGVDELVAASHDAGMRVVLASSDDTILHTVSADDVISTSEGIRAGIRRLQREGRGVCLVATGHSTGLPLADLALGLCRTGEPIPWGAHVLVRDDLTEVRLIIASSVRAREVSKQSVNVALGSAGFAALVSAGGLLPLTTRRVMFVVNSATFMSMMNGLRGSIAIRRLALPPSRDPTPWHALDADGVLARLGSKRDGLVRTDVMSRKLPLQDVASAAREFGEAITDELFNPLAPLLAAGAGLSAAVGSTVDAAMVGSVVFLNAFIGGTQRFSAERKLRLLARSERRRATVRRDGEVVSADASELVPGDIVILTAGDVVPADCRVLEATLLEVDASSLTGESLPVRKFAAPSFEAQAADRTSMVYEGTTIVAGQATAVVVAVGDHTEAHRGAAGTKGSRGPAGVERRLRDLMRTTGPVALAAGVGAVGGGLLRGRKLEDLVGSAVSLAVASVPEGLPLLATAAQLAASERLSSRGAIVRNVRAIEALGRADVVCLDKTGTLTEGCLALALVSDGETEAQPDALPASLRPVLAAGLRATLGSYAALLRSDPTDAALAAAAQLAGVSAAEETSGWTQVSELSLTVGRAYHAVLGQGKDGTWLSVKGAPEVLLLQCSHYHRDGEVRPMDDLSRMALIQATSRLAAQGLRVIAVAERAMAGDAQLGPEEVVDLTFRGFLALRDPTRPSAAAAIQGLRRAGVRTVMITGDHPSTAEAIASELDLIDGGSVMTGAELAALNDEDLDERVGGVSVFARVTPSQKVRIVRALQRSGRAVAMAGDGANDAAAIRLADVGIAVGQQSTQAARSAADVVVLDGRIETIVDAIVEGRAMWASVRNAVSILMGGNLGEIGFTLLAGLVDGSPPLHARQLLLVNLLTDIAPAMAIALRPPEARTFEALARETPAAALGAPLDREMATRAIVTALGAGTAWTIGRLIGTRAKARTIGLLALVGTQLGQTITTGGFSRPVLLTSLASAGVLTLLVQTPGVSHFFGCRPVGPISWSAAIGASVAATALSSVVDRAVGSVYGRIISEEPAGPVSAPVGLLAPA